MVKPGQFGEIERATDAELTSACATLVLCWHVPLADEDVRAIEGLVGVYETEGLLAEEGRAKLIAILHKLLAPHAN